MNLDPPLPGPDLNNQLMVLGSRGATPPSREHGSHYGTHTTCFGIEQEESLLFIDAGSGLVNARSLLLQPHPQKSIHIFLTHLHLDHLMGLPSFPPLYDPSYDIHLYGSSEQHGALQDYLRLLVAPPFWPLSIQKMAGSITLHELSNEVRELELGDAIIRWHPIPHSGACLSYRLDFPNRSLCIATDHEPIPELKDSFIDFASGVDTLVHDAQYTPIEYSKRRGWGHATWEIAAEIADRTNADQLLLTHHDVERTDQEIDSMVIQARNLFPNTYAAREGRRY